MANLSLREGLVFIKHGACCSIVFSKHGAGRTIELQPKLQNSSLFVGIFILITI